MSPLAILLGLAVRASPWAIVGGGGALVGSIAVRGARSADIPPVIPGLEDEADEAGPGGLPGTVTIRAQDLAAGALAGPLLALVLRPRPLGAFLGGLAAGAVAAALIPGPSANPAGGDRDDWRMPS